MKTLQTLLLLTLICCLRHGSAAPFATDLMMGPRCCEHFNQTLIPKGRVKHVGKSSSICSLDAIVFTTVCDKVYCFDAKMDWAKNRLAEFKSSGASFNKQKCSNTKKL